MEQRNLLNALTVADVWESVVKKPSTIVPDASLIALLEKSIEDLRTRHVYVVDKENQLLGVVSMTTLTELLFPLQALDAVTSDPYLFHRIRLGGQTVDEIMNKKPHTIYADSGLQDLAHILLEEKITEIPVVNKSNKLLGQVNVYEIIKAYLRLRQH